MSTRNSINNIGSYNPSVDGMFKYGGAVGSQAPDAGSLYQVRKSNENSIYDSGTKMKFSPVFVDEKNLYDSQKSKVDEDAMFSMRGRIASLVIPNEAKDAALQQLNNVSPMVDSGRASLKSWRESENDAKSEGSSVFNGRQFD